MPCRPSPEFTTSWLISARYGVQLGRAALRLCEWLNNNDVIRRDGLQDILCEMKQLHISYHIPLSILSEGEMLRS